MTLPIALALAGCLKKLDESLLDKKDAGGGSGGGTGGDASSSGGSVGDAGGIVPYDPAKFPVTKITTATPPVVLGTDDTDVYHAVFNQQDSALNHTPIAGGVPAQLASVERPHALTVPSASQFVFVVGGQNTSDGGSIVRVPKVGGAVEPIAVTSGTMGPAKAIYAGADGFAYVTFQADPQIHKPALARFGLGSGVTTATVLYSAATDESGGPVVASGNCVYWISSGGIFTMPSGGAADRATALSTQVADAVGLTADAANIYYTRSQDGSVWSRKLSLTCDGTGEAEKKLASGFKNIADVIRFSSAPTIAWLAKGDDTANYAGGGIFMMSVSGGEITQIAPQESGPTTLADSPFDVVFAVSTGEIRKVPKK